MQGTWLLLLVPVTAMAADLATCSRKWVKMNDRNYNRAISHYAECVLLGQALDPPARQKYQANIIINLKRTCNYFFDRSSLPTSNLIGVVREVAKILEDFEENNISLRKSWTNSMNQCATEPTKVSTRTSVTMSTQVSAPTEDYSKKFGISAGYIFMTLIFFILLLLSQIIFLVWFFFCNNCMFLELCKSETRCKCTDLNKEESPASDTYYMQEIQHDLASLSSENLGSDSEFEALLKMNKLPKGRDHFHSKEVD